MPGTKLLAAAMVVLAAFACSAASCFAQAKDKSKQQVGPQVPQSTHFPILLLGFGENPSWSVRIGQKGPERLDRPGYPPIALTPTEVAREGTADVWNYNATDSATQAKVSARLSREACSDAANTTKYTFRIVLQHAQIGTLNGCAKIATELFPKLGNQTTDDDTEEKKPNPADVIKFKKPISVAYVNPAGHVIVVRGTVKKTAAPAGSDLALSHDGRHLLYVRSDSKNAANATMVQYDFDTGRSRDLLHGDVHQPFWSPDDSRIAFLNHQAGRRQIWLAASSAPEQAAPIYPGDISALEGWADARTLVATDLQSLYWIGDDGRVTQTVPITDVYGSLFEAVSSDTIRLHPANGDLLMVSARYREPPADAPSGFGDSFYGIFLYEVRAKRRTVLSPTDQWANGGEWSRDGVQVFYTRRLAGTAETYRMFWDGSEPKRYSEGTDFVVGE
jgi:uncharacterized membrane protein